MKFIAKDNVVIFTARVVPRASKSEIVGEHDGALKIRLAAPPVEGAANEELIRVLAKFFDVARSDVEILSGATAKTKTVKVSGADSNDLQRLLSEI